MKLRNFIFGLAATFAVTGLVITPAWATDVAQPDENAPVVTSETEPTSATKPEATDSTLPASTFSEEEVGDDAGAFWFGKNLLFAGNNATANQISRGLLFAAGNNLQLNSQSEYAFIAGNNVNLNAAATEKDLFAVGNTVTVLKNTKVGRDVFAGANRFLLEANVPGDVSVAANTAILKDVTIKGNVNIDAEFITFQGKVKIEGTLSYNNNATVSGLTNVEAAKTETYTPKNRATTAGEVWLTKMMSVIGLFFTIAIIFFAFPRTKSDIARETTVQRFGVNLIIGIAFTVVVPLLSILFLMSFFAASTGIFLIVVYFIIFYLSQAFSGAWLGHVIVEKLCHCTLPMLLEALIGILIIACATMIPGLGLLVSTLSLVLGIGLVISCLRSGHASEKEPTDKRVYYADDTSDQKSSKAATKVKPSSAKAKSSSVKKPASSRKSPATSKSAPKAKTTKSSTPKTKK